MSNSLERFSTKQTVPPHHPGFCNACIQMEYKDIFPFDRKEYTGPLILLSNQCIHLVHRKISQDVGNRQFSWLRFIVFLHLPKSCLSVVSCLKTQRHSGETAAVLHRDSLLSPRKGHLFPCLYEVFPCTKFSSYL